MLDNIADEYQNEDEKKRKKHEENGRVEKVDNKINLIIK